MFTFSNAFYYVHDWIGFLDPGIEVENLFFSDALSYLPSKQPRCFASG